jgi:hypothetical protein
MGLGWAERAHLTWLHGEVLLKARALIQETIHHLILRRIGALASKSVKLSARPSSYKAVLLKGSVILGMFVELAKGVPRCRAFGASHKRHDD